MPEKKVTSVRQLAKVLGISHTTVAEALRNKPQVSKKTRLRVQEAAKELGYEHNPLAGELMSRIRQSATGTFRGVLALVDLEGDAVRPEPSNAFHHSIALGAHEAASRLGYNIDKFDLGQSRLSPSRFSQVLKSRGIKGVMILPSFTKPNISDWDWDHLTGIYSDYLIDDPAIHTLSPDHFKAMTVALQEVHRLSYKRPGLVLRKAHDHRVLFRWEAAYSTYLSHNTELRLLEPLMVDKLTKEAFLGWYQTQKPDVVLAHGRKCLDWLVEEGYSVPGDCGYCSLNVETCSIESAGLYLQAELIGSRAIETLVAQLQRGEYGVPANPSAVMVPTLWKAGPTLKEH